MQGHVIIMRDLGVQILRDFFRHARMQRGKAPALARARAYLHTRADLGGEVWGL